MTNENEIPERGYALPRKAGHSGTGRIPGRMRFRKRVRALADTGMSVREVAEKVSTRYHPASKSTFQPILAANGT